MRPLSPFQQAQQKLEAALQEFHQACANDQQFEREVRAAVDREQPYILGGGTGSTGGGLKSYQEGRR